MVIDRVTGVVNVGAVTLTVMRVMSLLGQGGKLGKPQLAAAEINIGRYNWRIRGPVAAPEVF